MGHGITETDNLFSVRESMWHNLGTVLTEYPTRDEVQSLVFPWEPIAEPIYRAMPIVTDEGDLETKYEVIEGKVEQRRSDNGAHLGVTSTSFTTVTNAEMLDVADALQNVPAGDVLYETGGSLEGGAHVWLMLRLAEPLVIKGDPHGAVLPFYMLQNKHNATGAFKGSATQVRAVCKNTIRAADLDSEQRGTEFTFHHTKNIADRIAEARDALAGWRESVEAYRLLAEHMVALPVSKQAELDFLDRFIPAPPSAATSERVKTNIETARGQWMECYKSVTCEGITGTAWGLLQASSEWSEHIRRAKGSIDQQHANRFKRAMLNRNEVIGAAKHFALEAAGA